MSADSAIIPADEGAGGFDRGRTGVACFLCTEAAFFSTLIVAYITYIGQSTSGPTPRDSLSLTLGILNSVFLLSSSATMVHAERKLARGMIGAFRAWLAVTMVLAAAFLVTTGIEWENLIVHDGLTIGRNLFGTTYFTLLGFHAAHVTLGLTAMLVMQARFSRIAPPQRAVSLVELLGWYWHFVDGVWVVIFLVVYVIGR